LAETLPKELEKRSPPYPVLCVCCT